MRSTMSECQQWKTKVLKSGVSFSPKMAGNRLYSTVYDEQTYYCMYALNILQ
jgi:hypothetical protein